MAGLDDLVTESGKLTVPGIGNDIGVSTNKELMAKARVSLSGNWGLAVLGYVLYILVIMSFLIFLEAIVFFVSASSSGSQAEFSTRLATASAIAQLVPMLISGPLVVGFVGFFLGIAQAGSARLETLFVGFQRFWKSFGVYFLCGLFVYLWTLLLVIPGIIAVFRYAMAYFIIADDEDCGPLEAISRSKEMMKGNKWKFFCLNCRFFGWAILATLTLGLGYIWLVPYMQTTFAKFYEDVK